MTKSRKRFLPQFDSLESRVVPAGNVTVTFKNHLLSIVGDNEANSVSVAANADGTFTVTGGEGTTVNGGADPFSTATPGNGGGKGNSGKDKDKGGGKGKLLVKAPAAVRLSINMRGGDDTVDVTGSAATTGKNTSIKLGQGNDSLTVDGLFAGDNARINGESGDDEITFTGGGITRSALVSGGVGADTIIIDGAVFGKAAHIDGGNGADVVTVTGSTFGDDARFNMGPGDDALSLGGNTFTKRDRFEGGSGQDTLTDGGNTFAAKHVVKGFETVEEGEVHPPGTVIASDDTATVAPGGTVTITVLANDTATAPNVLAPGSVVIVTAPTHGTATVNPDGTVTYTNTDATATTDTFTYTVTDDGGHVSEPATVTVTIGGATTNQAPVANNDTFRVTRGAAGVVLNLTANDTDAEGQLNLGSIEIVTPPTEGTLTVNADGTVSYSSNAASTATTDTFTYTVKDQEGLTSNLATVSITLE